MAASPESEAEHYLQPYLDAYYGSLTEENLEIGRFLHDVTRPRVHDRPTRALDVGCGSSMLYWGMFMQPYDAHDGLDGLPSNLDAVRAEIAKVRRGEVHDRYLEIGRWFGDAGPERLVALCDRVGRLEAVDFASPWPFAAGSMELVTMLFAAECLPTFEALGAALAEARRVLNADGRLVIVSLCETTSWKINDYVGSCLRLTADLLGDALTRAGFVDVRAERRSAETAAAKDQGYHWMLFATADAR
ncbi:MAG: methyltransferase domain-containing protein [Polyangiales bacterium]